MKLEVIRVMDDEGRVVHPEREPDLSGDELRKLFRTIVLVRILDERMLRAAAPGAHRLLPVVDRRGGDAHRRRARAAPRRLDLPLLPRGRAPRFCRGYPLRTFIGQLFGNADDPVKGRQMPVHHSVARLNFVSISSPIGTQIPQAVGTAWAAKLQGKDDVALVLLRRRRDVDAATSTPA